MLIFQWIEYLPTKQEVGGSNPPKHKCFVRLMVRTLPFHGNNVGSIPIQSNNVFLNH